jgi:hypothetical protein
MAKLSNSKEGRRRVTRPATAARPLGARGGRTAWLNCVVEGCSALCSRGEVKSNADAYLGRGLALAALGQRRNATADAAKALGLAEPTPERLYSAAQIHALAAIAAATEARQKGQDSVRLTTRYQDEAVQLLSAWFKRLSPAERSSALHDLLRDPALSPLRRLRVLELAGSVSSSAVPGRQPHP